MLLSNYFLLAKYFLLPLLIIIITINFRVISYDYSEMSIQSKLHSHVNFIVLIETNFCLWIQSFTRSVYLNVFG